MSLVFKKYKKAIHKNKAHVFIIFASGAMIAASAGLVFLGKNSGVDFIKNIGLGVGAINSLLLVGGAVLLKRDYEHEKLDEEIQEKLELLDNFFDDFAKQQTLKV